MGRKKRKKCPPLESDEMVKRIHRRAGRAALPPNKVFRDKAKYSRKVKHRKSGYPEGFGGRSFFLPFFPSFLRS